MSDDLLRKLAAKAGIDTYWRDQKGAEHAVGVETLRKLLSAIGLDGSTPIALRDSLAKVELAAPAADLRFLTARVGQRIKLPGQWRQGAEAQIELESGAVQSAGQVEGTGQGASLPAIDTPGYHRIRVANAEFTVAVAPTRAVTLGDLTHNKPCWGLAAQIYSLRRAGDGGVGDFAAAADLARAAGACGADMLALSPVHALFGAQSSRFSPYSPSSRLFYNPVHADPGATFSSELVQHIIAAGNLGAEMARLERLALIDWPGATGVRLAILRALHAWLGEPSQRGSLLHRDFDRFRAHAAPLLRDHAAFEALHAHLLSQNPAMGDWSNWPIAYRDPASAAVKQFVAEHGDEVDFQIFAQWVAGKSYAQCQRICRDSGMRIGLVADMAVGMVGDGSHAWSRQDDVLQGVSIGAPPDYYNEQGQSWGLTSFSPRGLAASGFQPFIETLRASLRYSGGLRIDHVMGMSRLWLAPDGAPALEGAYLNYPAETLFALIALESWRHKAIIIGEDLGTLPDGFREYLREQGIAGLRVLRFERDGNSYRPPGEWDRQAIALTTTHDLVPTAGWWAGSDLDAPAATDPPETGPHAIRAWDRGVLWGALQNAGVASGERPAPETPDAVLDAAIDFIAKTPCCARLLAIEDALGVADQPNVPGTTVEKPNWRHRLAGDSADLLNAPNVAARLRRLSA